MMMSEFTERTGFTPTNDEYTEIEQEYYKFDGDKNAFCKAWLKNGGIQKIAEARGRKIDELRQEAVDTGMKVGAEVTRLNKRIAELEAKLEREQEWKPFEDAHNVKQADYERLANAGDTKELTDDEAADLIANWFGFDRSKIVIVHEVVKEEINRHRECRRVGWYERKALYNATDWNYIVFNVHGNAAMGYEMHNGELQMYWG